MATISSAEFRKTYARLTDTTVVTVNGHAIGEWHPFTGSVRISEADYQTLDRLRPELRKDADDRYDASPAFSRRPFTPVPKHK